MKTFYTFLTILTSPIRSEDRQEWDWDGGSVTDWNIQGTIKIDETLTHLEKRSHKSTMTFVRGSYKSSCFKNRRALFQAYVLVVNFFGVRNFGIISPAIYNGFSSSCFSENSPCVWWCNVFSDIKKTFSEHFPLLWTFPEHSLCVCCVAYADDVIFLAT